MRPAYIARAGAAGAAKRAPPASSGRCEVLSEPVQDEPEALQAVAGLARARELVVLVREADEEHVLAELLERDEELLGLLDGAAEVVLGVDDEERSRHVLRKGHGRAG